MSKEPKYNFELKLSLKVDNRNIVKLYRQMEDMASAEEMEFELICLCVDALRLEYYDNYDRMREGLINAIDKRI